MSAAESNLTNGQKPMANDIKKEAEGSVVETDEKFEGNTMDAADRQQVASASPGLASCRRYGPARRFSLSDSSTDSSDSSHSWDHKRRGVNNKKLHKMRAAAKRPPKGPPLSPNTTSSPSSPSSSPSSPSAADAGLEKPTSPPSCKRLKVSSTTWKLVSSEPSAPYLGSDANRKRLELFQQNLRVVTEQIAKKYSEINFGGSRAAPGTIRRPRGGASSGNNRPAANPKKSPEKKTEEKRAKKN